MSSFSSLPEPLVLEREVQEREAEEEGGGKGGEETSCKVLPGEESEVGGQELWWLSWLPNICNEYHCCPNLNTVELLYRTP